MPLIITYCYGSGSLSLAIPVVTTPATKPFYNGFQVFSVYVIKDDENKEIIGTAHFCYKKDSIKVVRQINKVFQYTSMIQNKVNAAIQPAET